MKRFLLSLSLSLLLSIGFSQSASELKHEIDRLSKVTRVLYVAAHPDDENTRLISWLTNHEKIDVSYLSITRGDGGQNLIGTEIGDGLGLIRTHELTAARSIDGGHQFFTRAIDFGYSKTPEETLRFWEKDKVLEDMVRVIRTVRPDVIITRFSPEITPGRSTHGHHTASAKLALEAAELAADKSKYPNLKLSTHKTKKIFWNTSWWFYGSVEKMDEEVVKEPEKYIRLNVNQYLPLMGKTCSDISALSRSQHKSQGFGNAPVLGEQVELLQLLKGDHNGGDLFSGVKSNWSDYPEGKNIAKLLKSICSGFDVSSPDKSVNELILLKSEFEKLLQRDEWSFLANHRIQMLDEIIAQCLGLQIQAFTNQQKFYRGETIPFKLEVASFSKNVKVMLNEIQFQGSKPALTNIDSDLSTLYTLNDSMAAYHFNETQPYWFRDAKTLGSYSWPENLIEKGHPMNRYPYTMNLVMKVNGKRFVLPTNLVYGTTDPVKGLITQPILSTPDVMLNMDKEVYIFASDQAKKIRVDCITGKPGITGHVELILPPGWKSEPAFYKTSTSYKGQEQLFEFVVTPPAQQQSADVQAVFVSGDERFKLGIKEIKYDHIPNLAYYPEAKAAVRRIDLRKKGDRIGYLMGAGDKVPEALREMGYEVEILTVKDILEKELTYDAIVTGIRAFNVLDDIENTHSKLMDYVKSGGNMVVQYNTRHRLKSENLGPYPIKLSRDRVTEEGSIVTFTTKDHPVLKAPNDLSEEDFMEWTQERGLYFPNEWDERYSTIISIHDQNEEPKTGSVLITAYGEGYYVYTGLSFFRELPAGVPGAYRLLANMLSLGKE